MAINMPIQGTAADIMKIAMIRLHERLRGDGFRARMLLRCTTSCCSRCRATRSTELAPMVRETMEGALTLDVPLDVDVKVGDDWESMTPLPRADAIAAEADEVADVTRRCSEPSRGRDHRPRAAPAGRRRDDHGRPRVVAADPRSEDPTASRQAVVGRTIVDVGRRAKSWSSS